MRRFPFLFHLTNLEEREEGITQHGLQFQNMTVKHWNADPEIRRNHKEELLQRLFSVSILGNIKVVNLFLKC